MTDSVTPRRFSIVTPVYDPPTNVLREMVASVVAQTYADWELILVDDCSPTPEVVTTLRELAASDSRIVVIERAENGGIVAASNEGLSVARGEFVALLDHDDTLDPQALEVVDLFAQHHPQMDYCYSDEDHIAPDGSSINAFHKPAWSPERLRSQNYCCHFSVFRNTLLHKVGGFREGFDGSQDYDLILRATEQARQIVHVPMILYHWRQIATSVASNPEAKPYAYEAGRRAVAEHCRRMEIDAVVEEGEARGTYRVVRRIEGDPLVSVVIATDGRSGQAWGVERCFAVEAIASVRRHTSRQIEFVLVVASSAPPQDVAAMVRAAGSVSTIVVPFDGDFAPSPMLNLGSVHATGDFILFLGDDTEVIREEFLEPLLGLAADESVGAVGAKLYSSDWRIHHAGYVLTGEPEPVLRGFAGHDTGTGSMLDVQRECVAVAAECLLMRADVFGSVGGMSAQMPTYYFDVDLSLKLAQKGLRHVWTPAAELFAFDVRPSDVAARERDLSALSRRWGSRLEQDPYVGGTTKLA